MLPLIPVVRRYELALRVAPLFEFEFLAINLTIILTVKAEIWRVWIVTVAVML